MRGACMSRIPSLYQWGLLQLLMIAEITVAGPIGAIGSTPDLLD